MSEMKRLCAPVLWSKASVVRTGRSAEIHVPEPQYRQLRELLDRYGGRDPLGDELEAARASGLRVAHGDVRSTPMVSDAEEGLRHSQDGQFAARTRSDAQRMRARRPR